MGNRVFCIGELLIDFICKDVGTTLVDGVNFEKKAGGAPANVAAAVTKLGGKASFLGQVGDDSFGKFLVSILKDVNIDVSMTKIEGNTTLAYVAIDKNGERDFEFKRGCDGDYGYSNIDLTKINNSDIIHFGSATGLLDGELKNTYFELLDYAKKNGIFVSFDPNYRDALITEDKLDQFIKDSKEFIKVSDIIKLSDEEIKLITGENDIESGVNYLHKLGVKVIAVTLGSKGTLLSIDGESIVVPSIKIKQVDSTGAGDAFVGAVLRQVSEIEDKKSINKEKWIEIIEFANKVGAITCTNYGAINSIPTLNEVK